VQRVSRTTSRIYASMANQSNCENTSNLGKPNESSPPITQNDNLMSQEATINLNNELASTHSNTLLLSKCVTENSSKDNIPPVEEAHRNEASSPDALITEHLQQSSDDGLESEESDNEGTNKENRENRLSGAERRQLQFEETLFEFSSARGTPKTDEQMMSPPFIPLTSPLGILTQPARYASPRKLFSSAPISPQAPDTSSQQTQTIGSPYVLHTNVNIASTPSPSSENTTKSLNFSEIVTLISSQKTLPPLDDLPRFVFFGFSLLCQSSLTGK
jgi:hypothetical protein